ncbi:hypothetical protein ACGFNP_46655 [Nonomuraea sp. NPDC049269]|uniref:hypothetical protein n=1 Tax=Nonomuraea sp. NPDC049269 TaxID=3364349 RepID=UPI003711CB84
MWRWVAQAEIDGGEAPGVTIEENEENRRLREDAILKADNFLRRGARPLQRLMVAFIDEQRSPDGSDRPG